jgi:predicted Zn-dependent protease
MVNKVLLEILDANQKALQRAKYSFISPDKQKITYKPFFTSISLRDLEKYSIIISNGGVLTRDYNKDHGLSGRVEVRIGDYHLGGGIGSCDFILPRDYNKPSANIELWKASNDAFWECVEDLSCRNQSAIGSQNTREKYSFFSKEKSHKFIGKEYAIDLNLPELEEILKETSLKILDKNILGSTIAFNVNREGKYMLNSEGSRIYFDYIRYFLNLTLTGVDPVHNWVMNTSRTIYARDWREFPKKEQLIEIGEKLKKELRDKIKAPLQKNGSYPVIMDPKNHGVLWHEVIGHSLEGSSMQENYGLQYVDEDSNGSSKISIFSGKLGHKVAPSFISVEDNPTLRELDGYYPFDDEAVKSKRVCLIKDGILRNYLHCRSSAAYFQKKSNGHGRSAGIKDPVARMSNLIVRSSNQVSLENLKENLIKECEKQNEPYGLMFIDSEGGLSLPKEAQFSTFPSRVLRIYRNGREQEVRGIYLVGTPYSILRNIIQTSDRYEQFRGVCGADSGWIPSVEIAPDALVRSVEINKIPEDSYNSLKQPVIEMPKRK